MGEKGVEAHPILHETGGHFTFPHPSGLLPVLITGSNLVPALARLQRCEGTEDGKQVAPRHTEELPESNNLGCYSASFLCLFALSVQVHAVPFCLGLSLFVVLFSFFPSLLLSIDFPCMGFFFF